MRSLEVGKNRAGGSDADLVRTSLTKPGKATSRLGMVSEEAALERTHEKRILGTVARYIRPPPMKTLFSGKTLGAEKKKGMSTGEHRGGLRRGKNPPQLWGAYDHTLRRKD